MADLSGDEHRHHEARLVSRRQAEWGSVRAELITRHADGPCHGSMRTGVHVVCLFCDSGWTGVTNRIDDGALRRLGNAPGRIRIVPAGHTLHTAWQRGERTYLLAFVEPALLSDVLQEDHPHLSVCLKEQINLQNEGLERVLTGMREELERPGLSPDRMGRALAQQLAVGLLRLLTEDEQTVPARGGLRPSQLRAVTTLIEQGLGGSLMVGQLAECAGLSEHHFAHAFRQSTGQSPYRYILHRRLELATALLAETDLSLTDIALQTGFMGSSQFSTAFRRQFGIPPRDWRRRR